MICGNVIFGRKPQNNRQVNKVKQFFTLALKGAGMGAANVIPGVSGGTVALITGIFEELIDSIKSIDVTAIKLLLSGKLKEFAKHINLSFLIAVFIGVFISIVSLAKVLDYLFTYYPVYIWAFFFGLILASVYFVGKTVERWNVSVIISFIVGATIAVSISFLKPATQNESFFYLIICGVVAICSMILPGLSGSFVLILLGNYQLIVIDAVTNIRLGILLPVMIGAAVGLVAFSHLLSWIYKHFRDQTIGSLTGFILGSLALLWPWKESFDAAGSKITTNSVGAFIDQNGSIITEEIKVFRYEHIIPETLNSTVIIAFGLLLLGILTIWLMEKLAGTSKE